MPALCALESVTVELVEPGRFTDFTITDTSSRKELKTLSDEWVSFLETEVPEQVKAGGTLTLVFTDIDMAGDFEPWRSVSNPEIRYVRSVYRPRLEFSYRLVDPGGEEMKAGEESLTDMNFERGRAPGSDTELLFHEKLLMRDWIRRFDREINESEVTGDHR